MELTVRERQNIFKCRANDLDVMGNRNWKHDYISCTYCSDGSAETQKHILEMTLSHPRYSDLFSSELEDTVYVSSIIQDITLNIVMFYCVIQVWSLVNLVLNPKNIIILIFIIIIVVVMVGPG